MESASPPSLSKKEVLQGDIPHILEKIFLYLDFTSLKTCFEVSLDWRKILKSESFQKKAKDVFAVEIAMDVQKLVKASSEGNTEEIMQLLDLQIYRSTDLLDINGAAELDYDCYLLNPTTPLIIAAHKGRVNVVKLLLDSGADPNITDEDGAPPLHYAALEGHNNVIHMLLDRGADPNIKNEYGSTPLHYAAHNVGIVQLLLDHGADPNIKDADGETALHIAALRGHQDAMQVLLGKGADPNIKNLNTDTPLSLVLIDSEIDDANERRTVAQILLDGGANVIV